MEDKKENSETMWLIPKDEKNPYGIATILERRSLWRPFPTEYIAFYNRDGISIDKGSSSKRILDVSTQQLTIWNTQIYILDPR